LSYATRNTATGFLTQQWSWSTDGTTFTSISPAITGLTTTFALKTIDMSAINAIDNSANLYLKLTVTGATNATGNNRIDNVFVNASVFVGATTPVVTTTSPATSITTTSATMAANVTNIGGSAVTATGIVYAETSLVPTPTIGALSVTNLVTASPNTGTGAFSNPATSLSPNTQYSFRGYATNTQGTSYGSAATFYTLANVPNNPVVDNPTSSSLNVTIGTGDGNPFISNTQYAIQVDGGLFVQASGALGASPVWQTAPTWGTKTITGLTSNTLYLFAVKARNGNSIETAFSSSIGASTVTNLVATLTLASASPVFGSVCKATSISQSFSFNAINLNSTDFAIGSLSGFEFALSEFGTFASTLIIPNVATSVSGQVVWVKFTPALVQSYNGNISISGGGLPSAFLVAVTGAGVNTPAIVTTGSSTAITSLGATVTGTALQSCSAITSSGIQYSLNNLLTGSTSVTGLPATLAGLLANTQYFYRTFAIDASGTVNGSILSFTTANLDAPVATAATAIQDTSFIANWNMVVGATSYKLDVSDSPTFGTLVPASNLIISEYGEGAGGNKKYIEIYNGTGVSVNLANYEIWKNVNGSNWNFNTGNTLATLPLSLTGTLANGATYVIANNATDVLGANLYNTFLTFNGDDATGLAWNGGSGTTFTLIDVVGVQGIDPGTGWAVAGTANATVDKILIRKPTVLSPNTNWTTSAGTDVASSEWIVSASAYNATNQTTNLGLHTMNNGVASYLPGYENLSVSGTSQVVTGLTLGTTYYYRVVASSVSSTSTESNVISVLTVLPTKTKLTVASCNSTLLNIYSSINAIPVSLASGYRFRITNGASVQTIDRPVPWFFMSLLSSYDYSTTYTVDVMLKVGGVWLGYYGDSCTVTSPNLASPSLASIISPACGSSLATIYSTITANSIYGATGYKFRVTNGAEVQEFETLRNFFRMTNLASYVYGTTYTVEVAIKTTGAYSGYGPACTLSTPAVPQLDQCGATLPSGSTATSAGLTGVTWYTYEITTPTGIVVRNKVAPNFQVNSIPGYSSSTPYSVRLAVTSTGVQSPWGLACTINPAPAARFGNSVEPSTGLVTEFKAVGAPNPFETNFTLNVITTSDEKVQVVVYDMIGKQLESKEVNAADANTLKVGTNYPSGVYNVVVSQGVNVKSLRMIRR
jgi:hypothetical protein